MRRGAILLLGLALAAGPARAHDQWTAGGKIPDWVKASCCGPADAHHLTPGQVHDMGDYYQVDGFTAQIPKSVHGVAATNIIPSQDGDYWIFYRENPAGDDYYPGEGGHHTHHGASQSGVYCFFIPMET